MTPTEHTAAVLAARHWIDAIQTQPGVVIVTAEQRIQLAALGEEFDRLVELSTTNAAALLGKRGGKVRSKAKTAANLANGRKYTGQPRGGEAKRAAILSLHAQGKRGAEIAAEVGVDRSYVSRVINGKQ